MNSPLERKAFEIRRASPVLTVISLYENIIQRTCRVILNFQTEGLLFDLFGLINISPPDSMIVVIHIIKHLQVLNNRHRPLLTGSLGLVAAWCRAPSGSAVYQVQYRGGTAPSLSFKFSNSNSYMLSPSVPSEILYVCRFFS